jgi:hypothetical protein
VLFQDEHGGVEFVVDGLVGDEAMDWYFKEQGSGVMILEPKYWTGIPQIRNVPKTWSSFRELESQVSRLSLITFRKTLNPSSLLIYGVTSSRLCK